MPERDFEKLFDRNTLARLFPKERADEFFKALFGDPIEGAYDIRLQFAGQSEGLLHFEFHLHQRPGKCLACHLTQGLPQVFSRHPLINVGRLVREIDQRLGDRGQCGEWRLGATEYVSQRLHTIPLFISLDGH